MSEQAGQGAPDISAFMADMQGNTAEQPEVPQTEETQGQADSSLADGFLSQIPDADRAVVQRYVKDWDAGVTKRFQEIHDSYAPYKSLGEVEQLQQAVELFQMLDTQPEVVYEALKQHFESFPQAFPQGQQQQGQQNQQNRQLQQQPQQQSPLNPQLQQAINPFITPLQEKLEHQAKLLEQMASVIVQGNKQSQEQQEDAILEDYLDELREKHGDFPEDVILLHMYQNPGSSGDQAVTTWKQSMQQYMPASPPPPPVLTGGSVPDNSVDVGALDSKDVRTLVANVMAASQNP